MRRNIFRSILIVCFLSVNIAYAIQTSSMHPGMKVLIVGGGGREHALAWKMASSPWVSEVYVAPGNAGTALEPHVKNVSITAADINALLNFSIENKIDLTIVGPEVPLAEGIVDAFSAKGQHCFGPTRAAATIESSKIFSKEFMLRHRIPTARHAAFDDYATAKAYIEKQGTPIVIKADGLAAGKGVVVAQTQQEALNFLSELMVKGGLNNAGKRVLIEEFLEGEELSFIVVTDGKNVIALDSSQDHKRLNDNDLGPNTGGMGAYSPVKILTPALHQQIMHTIVVPTIHGMATEQVPYTGFLYVGLMITKNGPKVLEYNCRLGDPEAQALLLRLKSDLLELCAATIDGQLDKVSLQWDNRSAINIVVASVAYPNSSPDKTVLAIQNQPLCKDCKIFHSNTKEHGDQFIANSGRILSVAALGNNLQEARSNAYSAIENSHWQNVQFRKDIGRNELAREVLAKN